jgi:hypothetical protein
VLKNAMLSSLTAKDVNKPASIDGCRCHSVERSSSGVSSICSNLRMPLVSREGKLHRANTVRPKWRPWEIRGSDVELCD